MKPQVKTAQRFPLEINPDPIDLGVLNPGDSVRGMLLLRNPRDERLTVDRIETSCPCIRVEDLPLQIGPRETQSLTLSFDPSLDGEFTGAMGVDVAGYLSDGRVGFRTRVKIVVSPGFEDGE